MTQPLNNRPTMSKVIESLNLTDVDRQMLVTPILIGRVPTIKMLDIIVSELIIAGSEPTELFNKCFEASKDAMELGLFHPSAVFIGVTGYGNLVIVDSVDVFKEVVSTNNKSSTFIDMAGCKLPSSSVRFTEASARLASEVASGVADSTPEVTKPKIVDLDTIVDNLKTAVSSSVEALKNEEAQYTELRGKVNLSRKRLRELEDSLQVALRLQEERDILVAKLAGGKV